MRKLYTQRYAHALAIDRSLDSVKYCWDHGGSRARYVIQADFGEPQYQLCSRPANANRTSPDYVILSATTAVAGTIPLHRSARLVRIYDVPGIDRNVDAARVGACATS